jgi:hypothetical protein
MCSPTSPIGDFHRGIICEYLRRFHEPQELSGSGNASFVYRLIALPSFDVPLIVRIEVSAQRGSITVRTAQQIPGPQATPDEVNTLSAALNSTEIATVTRSVTANRFWTLPAVAAPPTPPPITDDSIPETVLICADGTIVSIEGLSAGRYHASRSDCETFPEFEKLASTILQLVSIKFPNASRPWMQEFTN